MGVHTGEMETPATLSTALLLLDHTPSPVMTPLHHPSPLLLHLLFLQHHHLLQVPHQHRQPPLAQHHLLDHQEEVFPATQTTVLRAVVTLCANMQDLQMT